MSVPENPAAFPMQMIPEWFEGQSGMSLRDYIATAVLAGVGTWTPLLPTGGGVSLNSAEAMRARAAWAYAQADAMLTHREGEGA